MRKLWISSASIALAFVAVPAHAADIEFSFEWGANPWGLTPQKGEIRGILYGLNESGFSRPAGVRITSIPGVAPSEQYTLLPPAATSASNYGLTPDHGVVTRAFYQALLKDKRGNLYELDLNTPPSTMGGVNALYHVTPAGKTQILGNARGFSGVRYTLVSAAVPEPATWMLMILGFGLVGYTLRQRTTRFNGAQLA